jgi:RecB family exonuclease
LALLAAREYREGRTQEESFKLAQQVLLSRLPSWRTTSRAAAVEVRRLAELENGKYGGFVTDQALSERLAEEFGPSRVWSATQLNDYGICPFRFFARHVLDIEAAPEPIEGLLAREVGSAYHRTLERIHSRFRAEGLEMSLDAGGALDRYADVLRIVEEACSAVLDEMAAKGEIRADALLEFEKAEFKRRIMRLLRTEAEWNATEKARPAAFEQRFGVGTAPPVVIDGEDGGISVRGVIDRIDESDKGLVVIDYKTGAAAISHREALEGRNLQLPIYLIAAREVVKQGSNVAGGYYLHINSCKKGSEFGRAPDPNLSVASITSRAKRFVRDYVRRVKSGEFPIRPNGPCPSYCEYDLMCRIQSLRASRTAQSPGPDGTVAFREGK